MESNVNKWKGNKCKSHYGEKNRKHSTNMIIKYGFNQLKLKQTTMKKFKN